MNKNAKIFVAGHKGLVGSAIIRELEQKKFTNLLTVSHKELDLTSQSMVQAFFEKEKPDYVIIAAAKVGGIYANNTYPADFIYENIMIESNIIHSSFQNNVKQLLFLGSSCIYPKLAEQPIKEEALLTGKLEQTNEPYALAKILGIKMCESYNRQYGTDFRSLMPTNLYGINDNFHAENSHVIPALMHRFHLAKVNNDDQVSVWGSGNVKREFLHVEDMASASLFVFLLSKEVYQLNTSPMLSHINVGTGLDISICKLAEIMKKVVGFSGEIKFDISKPDGPPRKVVDTTKLRDLGWSYNIDLELGLRGTYNWYLKRLKTRDEL
jgi:GDP-L-fucose synthase